MRLGTLKKWTVITHKLWFMHTIFMPLATKLVFEIKVDIKNKTLPEVTVAKIGVCQCVKIEPVELRNMIDKNLYSQ